MTPARHRDGFTLLEILAVVAIFALLAAIALPNFSTVKLRNLRNESDEIVAQLELTRQRAIVTGVPHRFFIDIDAGSYGIEWRPNTPGGEEPEADEAPAAVTVAGAPVAAARPIETRAPLETRAPREDELEFEPVPGLAGRVHRMRDSIFFAGIETPGGWVEDGETFIAFQRDGSADATTIVIEHESGQAAYLEVLPLADRIRVDYETL